MGDESCWRRSPEYPAQLRLVLKVVGTTVEFRQIVFDELIEQL